MADRYRAGLDLALQYLADFAVYRTLGSFDAAWLGGDRIERPRSVRKTVPDQSRWPGAWPALPAVLMAVALLFTSTDLFAQSGPSAETTETASRRNEQPAPRRFSLAFGLGNDFGWLGGQAERYFSGDRLSLFGGLGYMPAVGGHRSGFAGAGGIRGYAGGDQHRVFAELSISQTVVVTDGSGYYGPGIQLGYQYAADGGFTLLASAGAGLAPWLPPDVDAPDFPTLLNLGVGYTWR